MLSLCLSYSVGNAIQRISNKLSCQHDKTLLMSHLHWTPIYRGDGKLIKLVFRQ